MIKETVQIGSPIIRSRSKSVANAGSKKVQDTIKDLVDSMRYHDLVGMAAPQIGVGLRIFVSEVRSTKTRNKARTASLRVFINPQILKASKETVSDLEGCGSIVFGELLAEVKRPRSVIVRAMDENGKIFDLKAAGLLARIIQHENDHLNGIVFTDKADPKTYIDREEHLKKLRKLYRQKNRH